MFWPAWSRAVWATLRAPQPLMPSLVGAPPGEPMGTAFDSLLCGAEVIAGIATMMPNAISNGMLLVLALTFLHLLFRRTWIAMAVIVPLFFSASAVQLLSTTGAWTQLVPVALVLWLIVFVAVRFGLLTTIVMFFIGPLLSIVPLTADPSMRYFATAMWVLAAVIGLAVFAASALRAGLPLLRFAEDSPAQRQ